MDVSTTTPSLIKGILLGIESYPSVSNLVSSFIGILVGVIFKDKITNFIFNSKVSKKIKNTSVFKKIAIVIHINSHNKHNASPPPGIGTESRATGNPIFTTPDQSNPRNFICQKLKELFAGDTTIENDYWGAVQELERKNYFNASIGFVSIFCDAHGKLENINNFKKAGAELVSLKEAVDGLVGMDWSTLSERQAEDKLNNLERLFLIIYGRYTRL